jgi:hypothetical protein
MAQSETGCERGREKKKVDRTKKKKTGTHFSRKRPYSL